MLGVDFVINALLETSGFRPGGDCATAPLRTTARKTKVARKKIKDFIGLTLLRSAEYKAAKHNNTKNFPAFAFFFFGRRFGVRRWSAAFECFSTLPLTRPLRVLR